MQSSAPVVAMLPPIIPIDPAAGLFNWPTPTLPSGPTLHLSAWSETTEEARRDSELLHDVIFPQLSAYHPMLAATDQPVKVIAPSSVVIERADDPQPALSADPISPHRDDDHSALFEYGNTNLTRLPPGAIRQFGQLVERMLDHAVNYLNGEEALTDLRTSEQNFLFALQTLKGDSPKGRSPARGWISTDTPDRQAQKSARMLRMLREWVSATIMPTQIDTSLNSYSYTEGEYRYVFREWYGGDGLIVQCRAAGGYNAGRLAFSKLEVEAAKQASSGDWREQQAASERNRNPYRPAGRASVPPRAEPMDRLQGQIDDMNVRLKHAFFGRVEQQGGVTRG